MSSNRAHGFAKRAGQAAPEGKRLAFFSWEMLESGKERVVSEYAVVADASAFKRKPKAPGHWNAKAQAATPRAQPKTTMERPLRRIWRAHLQLRRCRRGLQAIAGAAKAQTDGHAEMQAGGDAEMREPQANSAFRAQADAATAVNAAKAAHEAAASRESDSPVIRRDRADRQSRAI